MPNLVRERLYLGGIKDAAIILQHGSDQITHVLSILNSSSISAFTEWRGEVAIASTDTKTVVSEQRVEYTLEKAGKDFKFVRMAVALGDSDTDNLIDYFDACLNFIDESRNDGGSVLVHCFAGVSRSAAVVAAFLMRSERLSARDALESLRQKRDCINPNDGFLKQLKWFEDLWCMVPEGGLAGKFRHPKPKKYSKAGKSGTDKRDRRKVI